MNFYNILSPSKQLNNHTSFYDILFLRRLSSRVSQYLWYKLWGNTKQGLLPDGYTQVDYIESSGTQYIDTGLIGTDLTDSEIELTIKNNTTGTNQYNFNGVYQSGKTTQMGTVATSNATCRSSINFGFTDAVVIDDLDITKFQKLYAKDGLQKVNNTQVGTESFGTLNEYPFLLFARTNINGTTTYIDFNKGSSIKSFWVKKNGKYIRNLVPCYRNSDNEVGMYDLANNVFYTNQGTGSFTYGSVAPTPSTPVEVKGVGERTENLFDISTAEDTEYFINNSGILVTGANGDRFISKKVMVAPLTEYTFSWGDTIVGTEDNSPYIRVSEYANTQFLSRVAYKCIDYVNKTFTIITSQYTTVLDIRYDSSTSLRQQTITNLMINSGSTAKPYEPYGYKIPIDCDSEIKNIYLNEPLHKINDYADILSYSEHNVVRKIKKRVFDGTENWGVYSGDGYKVFYLSDITDYLKATAVTSICTHYNTNSNVSGASQVQEGVCFITISSAYRLYIRDSGISSVNDLKSLLATQYANGTPVTIWYVLENEETEQIKAPDILADKYTSITVDTEVQLSQVDFTTKGKKVPQPSRETVRMLNSVNAINSIDMLNQSEELMTSEVEPSENLIEETKAELEEPIEKEQTDFIIK